MDILHQPDIHHLAGNISGKWRQFAVVYNHINIFSKNDMIQAFKTNNKWFWIYFINITWGVGGYSNGKQYYKGVHCNMGWHYFLKENIIFFYCYNNEVLILYMFCHAGACIKIIDKMFIYPLAQLWRNNPLPPGAAQPSLMFQSQLFQCSRTLTWIDPVGSRIIIYNGKILK